MKKALLSALVLIFCVSSVYADDYSFAEDFEDSYMTYGWNQVTRTNTQNHTPGGGWSDHLTTSSTSFTNIGGFSNKGVLDYWAYTDGTGDPTYGGYYDVQEIFLKDDNNALIAQLYIRPSGVRAYSPGAYQVSIPGSANQYLTGQWNHIVIDYDYVSGKFDLTVNAWSYSFGTFGLTDGATGNGVISYTWVHNNKNGADIYLDDVNLVDNTSVIPPPPPPEISAVSWEPDGVTLSFTALNPVYVTSGGYYQVMYKDDIADSWSLAEELGSSDTITAWTDSGDSVSGRPDPRGPLVSKRFYKLEVFQPFTGALPGWYVVTMKGRFSDGNEYTKLGMYSFNADGTITSKYWLWLIAESPAWYGWSVSDRMIGNGSSDPPGNNDADKYLVGLTKHLGPESNLGTDTGTWSLTGRRILIDWADTSWEKWYITWEEPGNLYKIEAYDASYKYAGSNFFLTTGFTRDTSAINAGWGFGGSVHDFTYGRPAGDMKVDYRGCSLNYTLYASDPPPEKPVTINEIAGLSTGHHVTDNGVVRGWEPDDGYGVVYRYLSKPASNPGILARRTIYQIGHDFNRDGHIQDNGGHVHGGLQIIDNAGNYRGTVLCQYQAGYWVTSRFWLDYSGVDARTGVLPE